LLIKARRAGYRIAEVRVTHLPRPAGQAKGARLDHIVRSLLELVHLRVDLLRRVDAPSPNPSPVRGRGAADQTVVERAEHPSPVRGRGE